VHSVNHCGLPTFARSKQAMDQRAEPPGWLSQELTVGRITCVYCAIISAVRQHAHTHGNFAHETASMLEGQGVAASR
jgi:hypothetical protein